MEANPSEDTAKVSAFHDTAKAMYARREAEVDAAFPASWTHPKAKKSVLASKMPITHGAPVKIGANKKWAEQVAYRQNQLNKYQSDRLKEREEQSKMQTHLEREKAAQQATRELTHLSKVSEEVLVFPHLLSTFQCSCRFLQRIGSRCVRTASFCTR